MPEPFSLTDNPPSINYIEMNRSGTEVTAATCTITITNLSNLLSPVPTSVYITATDGTLIRAEASPTSHEPATTSTTDTVTPTFIALDTINDTATNLATCLNATSKFTATSDGAVVTVTQVVVGSEGNGTVTEYSIGGVGLTFTNMVRGGLLGINTTPGSTSWETLEQSDDTFLGNRKYLIIVNARVGSDPESNVNSQNQLFAFRVTQDHDGSELTPTMIREPKSFDVPHSYNAAEIFTPSVDTKVNFQGKAFYQYYQAHLYYLRIVALDITDLREGIDYFHSVDSTAADHSTIATSRNVYTLEDDNFTNSLGNWLILNTALVDVNVVAGRSYGLTTKAGDGFYSRGTYGFNMTKRHSIQEEGEDTDERALLFSAYPEEVEEDAETISWRFTMQTGDPLGSGVANEYISSTMIGLKIEIFNDVVTNYTSTETASTSAGEITIESWTDQPSNDGKALIIACGAYDCGGEERSYWTGLDQDSVDVFGMGTGEANSAYALAGESNDPGDELPFVALGLVDLDSSTTHSYEWQFKKFISDSTVYEELGYAMFSLTYNYEDFYDEKVEIVKVGEVRRRRSSPTIPSIG